MTSFPIRFESYDVAVVGGGSAGVAASVAAARTGAKTVLIERYGFLGGAATQSLVLTYDGFFYRQPKAHWAVGGIGRELIDSLGQFGSPTKPKLSTNQNWMLPFAPEASKLALDHLVKTAGVTPRLHATLTGVRMGSDQIDSLIITDHAGVFEVKADQFIDASGEADLAALSGVPIIRDGKPPFAASLCSRIGGLTPGVLLDRETLKRTTAALPSVYGLAHLRPNGGFVLEIPGSDDFWWMGVDVRTDGLTSQSLSQAEQDSRVAAWAFVNQLRAEPGCTRATLVATGPQIGVRETRHPLARHMISEAEALSGTRSKTSIGRAAWNLERHDEIGNPTMVSIGGEGFFDIPLNALRAQGPRNLWLSGRIVGADRAAFGSLRVMGTAFATGHAAGVGAALAIRGQFEYEDLRTILLTQGAII
jgi:hypothetical protein